MTFRQRLIIAFSIVLVLPVLLFMLSFIVIGNMLVHTEGEKKAAQYWDYRSLSDDMQRNSATLDAIYDEIRDDMDKQPALMESPDYLQSLSEKVSDTHSYILVRKNGGVYYTGDEAAAAADLPKLPAYGLAQQTAGSGYYIEDMAKMIKQVDFVFPDGEEGSLFIITRVVSLISRKFLSGMFAAMVVILLLTAIL
ncbi:MAG: two-component sensor histidine kinase, partial [Eubacteriales bacterium]|nr:two-component sensor histidine kinase [Eubacteriales bacterium]